MRRGLDWTFGVLPALALIASLGCGDDARRRQAEEETAELQASVRGLIEEVGALERQAGDAPPPTEAQSIFVGWILDTCKRMSDQCRALNDACALCATSRVDVLACLAPCWQARSKCQEALDCYDVFAGIFMQAEGS